MRTFLLVAGVLAIATALAGCGDDGEQAASRTATEQAETTGGDAPTTATEETGATKTSTTEKDATAEQDATAEKDTSREQAPPHDDRAQAPGDDQPSSSGASSADAQAARETVLAFFDALVDGDGEKACALLAEPIKAQLAKGLDQSPQLKGKGCAGVLATVSENYTDAIREQLSGIDIVRTRPKGETVLVTYKAITTPQATVPVVNEDGEWKVGAAAGAP